MRRALKAVTCILLFAIWGAIARADDYETLMASLATPLFPTPQAAIEGYKETAVLIRTEQARQRLMGLFSVPNDLESIRTQALTKLAAANRSMEEIRRLDGNAPDISGIAQKGLGALGTAVVADRDPKGKLTAKGQQQVDNAVGELGGKVIGEGIKYVWNAIQSSWHWSDYRTHYTSAREAGLALGQVAANRCMASPPPNLYGIGVKFTTGQAGGKITEVTMGGPAAKAGLMVGDRFTSNRVAGFGGIGPMDDDDGLPQPGDKSSPLSVNVVRDGNLLTFNLTRSLELPIEKKLVALRFTGSWNGTFSNDWLELRNVSGRDLTNCVVVVTLEMDAPTPGQVYARKHLHFVKHWRANEQKFAMYNGADAGGVARNESLTNVQRLYVQLYSDQLRNTIAYPYWYSKDYDKDVQRFCEENLSFTGSFNKATNGLLGSDANCVVRLQDSGNQKVKVGSFTPSKITITVRQGTDSESLWWQGSRWESSVPGRTFKDAKFNRFDNPAFEMRLVFPGTDYEYIKSWRAR